jgi:mono/diheme cytochrome c family protein
MLLVYPAMALGQGDGAMVFGRCIPCHRGNGAGMVGIYAPLVNHAPEIAKASRTYLVTVLLYGVRGKIEIEGQKVPYDGVMPSFYSLTDEEAAAVLNYILTSWGNEKNLPKDFKKISADEVKAQRGKNLTDEQVYEIRRTLKLTK